MTVTSDKELNGLNLQRQCLIRDFDKKNIDEKTYQEKMNVLGKTIKEKVDILLNSNKIKQIVETEGEKIKMSKEQTIKRPGKKPMADSYTMLIVKALSTKGIKNVDEAVEKVNEWKPGRDKDKIKKQIKTIIYLCKSQKEKRWLKYNWDEENFLLTEK